MKFSLRQKIYLSFGAASLMLSAISIVSYQSIGNLVAATQWVPHTYRVLDMLGDVLSLIKNIETGQQGYVITGEEGHLAQYNLAVQDLDGKIKTLRILTADDPSQQRRLDTLEPLIASKLAITRQQIDFRRKGGFEVAVNAVLDDEGKKAVDDIRRVIAEMQRKERCDYPAQPDHAPAGRRNIEPDQF
ncbi:MAG: CHASE3 domain-containing protein [Chloroflexi bacterium]|nr:CHASE3 domain-containing protein [Chloroflexota bacterium]